MILDPDETVAQGFCGEAILSPDENHLVLRPYRHNFQFGRLFRERGIEMPDWSCGAWKTLRA